MSAPLFADGDTVLFQDVDGTTTTMHIDGRATTLKPTKGALSAEWGSREGTPVEASFSNHRYGVDFTGKVAETCYETESCEAIWYTGTLRVTSSRQATKSIEVSGACGC